MHVDVLPREVKSLLQITLCNCVATNYISTLTSPLLALFCTKYVHVIVITCETLKDEGTGTYILSDF